MNSSILDTICSNSLIANSTNSLSVYEYEPKILLRIIVLLRNDFLYSNLEYHASKIANMAGNHAVPLINKTSFSQIELFFPPTKEEQQKIANTLSSLDHLIKEQSNKIEQLKSHKKGLMQGLFPKVNN